MKNPLGVATSKGAFHLVGLTVIVVPVTPPVAETGRSCWGSGQQDASGSEADAGSRNPGSF